ncbi:class I SAM-dependent methyltransferase [Burkholderia ubonensis]|uniref:class I SAM-dependent methyltransferase n=1 Tax=Burkholderia ubonensis TaxID=101571 RepID=UPI000753E3EA|nr:methyltransferase domain-containing protein [Burkholderia ubonensis]KVZ45586.1 methyltransferase [Burkholderia ubonensis]
MIWPNAWRVSALFVREWVDRPAAVGALCPSSPRLACEIASAVPAGEGLVIELGGGTGAVTRALLEHGIAPERLVVVERSHVFARHLQARFPAVTIAHGDAAELDRLLPPDTRVDAIVSCLPLRSLPRQVVSTIVGQCHQALSSDGVMIQFTYDLRSQAYRPSRYPGFVVTRSPIVWRNIPPARIDVMHKQDR